MKGTQVNKIHIQEIATMREKTERLEAESLGYRRTADEAETSAEQIKSERRGMQREVHLLRTHNKSMVPHLIKSCSIGHYRLTILVGKTCC